LEKKISFDMIPASVGAALDSMEIKLEPAVYDIISAYRDAYTFTEGMCS
jgi:hypothetical protein